MQEDSIFLTLSSFPLPLSQQLNLSTASFKKCWILIKYFRERSCKTLINTNLTDTKVHLYFAWDTHQFEIFGILLQ